MGQGIVPAQGNAYPTDSQILSLTMISYLIRRVLLIIPTLLGMTAVVFFIMNAAPGNVAELLISREGEMQPGDRQARIEYISKRYGLDDPAMVQYVRWLNKVSPVGLWNDVLPDDTETVYVSGYGFAVGKNQEGLVRRVGIKVPDLGQSFIKNRSVLFLVGQALPITLLLNVLSIPLVYIIAIVTGAYAARNRGKFFDISSSSLMLALWSVPTIWAGVMLQGFLANEQYFSWFPSMGLHDLHADAMTFLPRYTDSGFQAGWLLDMAWHLVLPVICLSYGSFAFMSKLTRGAMLENILADYVRTARAKGVNKKDILWRHVFRNSLLPLITVAAFIIPGLLGGSIVIEYIFSIPGMGKLMIESIEFKDQEVVMAVTLISGILTLFAYLVADLLYAVADPRVTYN